MSIPRLLAAAAASVVLALPGQVWAADPPNDAFVAGYAAAVVEREFGIKSSGLSVHDGHLTFPAAAASGAERGQLLKALAAVPGVKDVTLVATEEPAKLDAGRPLENDTVRSEPAAGTLSAATTRPAEDRDAETKIAVDTDDGDLKLWLGAGRVFAPLAADPRWPHLFASYNNYDHDIADTHLRNVGSVGFGETVSFLKQEFPSGFRQEVGIQGGLFAIFDLDSDSADLINADYFVGPYYALRYQNFSLMARVYHQSSHLGDEYLLRAEHEDRVNFSFETYNLLLSYLPYGFRVYGGGGYQFDVDPGDFNKGNIEYGVEWTDPETIPGIRWARPVAAIDMQNRALYDWTFSYSVRAGIQLEDPTRFSQRLQIMLEYYDGNSPNGQFYDDHIRFLGIGAHFYF